MIDVTRKFTTPKPRLKWSATAPITDGDKAVKARLNATEVVIEGTYRSYVRHDELDAVIALLEGARAALKERDALEAEWAAKLVVGK